MAGVLLIEKYANKYGKSDYAIILFYNLDKEVYEDPGGHLMTGMSVQESAITELIEESCNLFRLSPFMLNQYVVHKNFHSFPLYVKGPIDIYGNNPIYSKYYHHNRKIIHNSRAPHMYKETDNMRRFYISDLVNSGLFFNRGTVVCPDANGHVRKISSRTVGILKMLFYDGLVSIENGFIFVNILPLYLNINYEYLSSDKPFLNGTIDYF